MRIITGKGTHNLTASELQQHYQAPRPYSVVTRTRRSLLENVSLPSERLTPLSVMRNQLRALLKPLATTLSSYSRGFKMGLNCVYKRARTYTPDQCVDSGLGAMCRYVYCVKTTYTCVGIVSFTIPRNVILESI